MLDKFSKRRSASAHVIVLGNEKGGSGKSTVASHVAVGLLKAGHRVATIDLDARQQSFTRYINNRRAWAAHTGLDLAVPVHFCIEQGRAMQIADNEELECQRLIANGVQLFHAEKVRERRRIPQRQDAPKVG